MRLFPRSLPELYAHAIIVERGASERFAELERYMRDAGMEHIADELGSIGREEREQYELLKVGTAGHELPPISPWEYSPHFLGAQFDVERKPTSVRDALAIAISAERRTQTFYVDVAEHTGDDTICAFAAEMAAGESRHIARLERLLAREPDPAATVAGEGDVLPLKP
ncbi:MAG: ferritin-like domain-containing protein [Burkholderiales bacterium]